MRPHFPLRRGVSAFCLFAFTCLLSFALLPLARGQSADTGSIAGRVFNPATGEYVRKAQIQVEGTNLVAASLSGGYFHLHNVPAGRATIVATYPGAAAVTATVEVSAGATATHDFELSLISSHRTGDDDVVMLGDFVVEAEREGQSKMVAEQKQAVNIKQVMSSDNFGDMSEQNVGEFLKYMPGITIDYVETDTRTASLSGMDPKYGYVTLDGNAQASGDSGSFGGNSRQFEFESISMNNIESIEVNRTLTADMWADAPAGTVNLRTRSALDVKRSRLGFSTGLIWNSMEKGLSATPRHDDDLHRKTRPRLSFDYTSGAILGGKLGITLNGSLTSIYKEQFRHSLGYDYTSTQAIAAGTPLVTSVNFKDGPKITSKYAGGIKIDYEPFPNLRLTTAASFSWFDDFFANRNLNFVTTSANLGAGSSLTRVVANNSNNTNTRIDQTGESTGKLKDNTNLSTIINYKLGLWTFDLSFLYSRARERRGSLYYDTIGNTPIRLSRIGFTADRPDIDSAAWTINQTSGRSWYDWTAWGAFDAQDVNGNKQHGKTDQYTGRLDVSRVMRWEIPTTYKFGFGRNVTFKHRWVTESFIGRYVGTTGNALTALEPLSRAEFLITKGFGGSVAPLPVVDKQAMFDIQRDNPEQYTQTEANLATQLNNILSSYQGNQEDIKAAYVMQESRLGKWQLAGGLRYENTHTRSAVPFDVPIPDNPFATFNAGTGVYSAVNTRDYVAYRWSQGRVTTYGDYDDWMPSAAAKYPIRENLFLKLGYNKAIKRPDLNRTSGPWTVDVTSGDVVVTVPNPGLQPERSQRFSAMLEYYFEPAGTLGVHVFQSDITNAIDDNPEGVTAAEAGFGDDPIYDGLLFRTYTNLDEVRRVRGVELSYSQQLRFFQNEFLRAFSVFANFSQYTANPRPRTGTRYVPRFASGGVTWSYGRFFFQVNGTWTDKTFTGANTVAATAAYHAGEAELFKPRTILFVNARFKLNENLSLFVSGDRAYDSGKIWYYPSDNRLRQVEKYGSQWSFGVKGEF